MILLTTDNFRVQHTPDGCLKNSTILRNSIGGDDDFERQSAQPKVSFGIIITMKFLFDGPIEILAIFLF
ncbi:hypothetical protein CCAJJPOJ_03579 [Lelliottia sp. T2.26D-8]|nr:hypothetical protein [Lelliottia amnigena]CAI9402297.1 hypothetical protein CCAJJPOJ_03579 [Lelliottia sp. T2.26D-8]